MITGPSSDRFSYAQPSFGASRRTLLRARGAYRMLATFFTAAAISGTAEAGLMDVQSMPISANLEETGEQGGFGGSSQTVAFELAKFDPTLGSLQSARFQLEGSLFESVTANGEELAPDGFTLVQAMLSSDVFIFGATDLSAPIDISFSSSVNASCDASFIAPCSATDAASRNVALDFIFEVNDLSALAGAGTLSGDITFSAGYLLDVISDFSSGSGSLDYVLGFDGVASITYDFLPTTVPSPSPLSLMGLCLLAFASRRRLCGTSLTVP